VSAERWWQWPAFTLLALFTLHDARILIRKAWIAPKTTVPMRNMGQPLIWSTVWVTLTLAVALTMVPK